MKTYNSKLGLETIVPIAIIFGGILIKIISEKNWTVFTIALMVIALISYVYITTKYSIENENLNIKTGFLFSQNIDIKTIRKIEETTSILTAPATSIDRSEVFYNKLDSVLISPKAKKDFINHLTAINPNIEVKYKNS